MNTRDPPAPAGVRALLASQLGSRIGPAFTAFLIAVLFVVAVEQLVGWSSILYPWRFVQEPLWVVAATACVGFTYVLRTVRVYRYFALKQGFGVCLRLMLQHNLLLNLLPFRTGEFAFPVLMRRYFSIPAGRSVPGLLWLRMLDLHVLLLMLIGVAGIMFSLAWGAAVTVLWIGALFAVQQGTCKLSGPLLRHRNGLLTSIGKMLAAVPENRAVMLEMWLLTLVNWLLKLVIFAWIIRLFASTGFGVSLAGAVGGELTAILPVHGLAGVGTYEAGIVAAMRGLGGTLSEGLTGAVNLHLLVLGISVAGGFVSLLLPSQRQAGE